MSWPVTIENVVKMQMEITNYCQARCPECAREKFYDDAFIKYHNTQTSPYRFELNNKFVTLEQFKSWFNKDNWKNLELIDFCGNYDEPTTNPDIIKIIKWILDSKIFNPNLQVNIATNGGTRSTKFWAELASLCKYKTPRDKTRLRVIWGIDGLEDTNHLYRRNVNWTKLQDNFRSFISNGGYAYWQFIYFKHNEHQAEEVKQRSIKENFAGIKWRGGHSRDYQLGNIKPSDKGKFQKTIGHDTIPKFEIKCKAIDRPEYHGLSTGLYVTHHGWVIPCCWWGTEVELSKMWETYGKEYDSESHKLNGSNSFQEILDSGWFSNLHNYILSKQPPTCVSHCKENILGAIFTEKN